MHLVRALDALGGGGVLMKPPPHMKNDCRNFPNHEQIICRNQLSSGRSRVSVAARAKQAVERAPPLEALPPFLTSGRPPPRRRWRRPRS